MAVIHSSVSDLVLQEYLALFIFFRRKRLYTPPVNADQIKVEH